MSKIACFAKIVNGWIPFNCFYKKFQPRCLIGFRMYLCLSRPLFLLLSIEPSTFNISSGSFLFKRCNKIMFETRSNLTMRNQNGVDIVVMVSLLLTWNMLTRILTISISDNEHQVNTVGMNPLAISMSWYILSLCFKLKTWKNGLTKTFKFKDLVL